MPIHQEVVPLHIVDGEYIKEWLVIGPFIPDALATDFLADAGGEAQIAPNADDSVITQEGKRLTWKGYTTRGNIIDLIDAVGNHENVTAYAFCMLHTEAADDTEIRLGSDDGVAVWINGMRLHSNSVSRSLTLDEDMFEVCLKAGANRCLVKISQKAVNWGFAMRATILPPNRAVLEGRITDEANNPISEADVRLEPQESPETISAKTDASGVYRLNVYPVGGTYDLSATAGERGDCQLGIQLRGGERRTLPIILKEAICIEGRLQMFDDTTPHVAVPVQAVRINKSTNQQIDARLASGCREEVTHTTVNSEVASTTLSDETGRYRFINLKPGKYQIRCQVRGGYIYYDEREKTRNPEESKTHGESFNCRVEHGKPLTDIDFRFVPFKKGKWKNYGYLDGLGHNFVRAIYGAADGVIWFSTSSGVSCYDGKEFTNLTTEDGLGHNCVVAIYGDPDGVIWFGTGDWQSDGGGVSRYDGKTFTNFTTRDGLAYDRVTAIHHDADGVMWFGTGNRSGGGGVSRYDGRKFVNYTTQDGLADNRVFAIHRDPDGMMWFGTANGISRYDGKTFVTYTTQDGLADNRVFAIHRDPDGVTWFGTKGGVSRLEAPIERPKGRTTFVNLTTQDGLVDNRVVAICRAPDGLMWFGTEGGLSCYDGNAFVNFTTQDGLLSNRVFAIYRAPDGAMWFGERAAET